MTDFKNVLLTEIKPDPNQPRKFYDEQAMQELTDSVREKGILQPILVRPNGKGYVLVCGERRYKASVAVQALVKTRDTIPAVIRELSNDEALELQIIENLQRKDVHPMEEAVAFKSLMEKKMPVEEVAAKVGKSVYYIRQRIKLNDLTKDWQEIYFHNLIENKRALDIALFNQKDQQTIYKTCVRKSGKELSVSISEWQLREFSGNLESAPFDKKDPTLNPEMGPCTTCKFNTAVACLFPEDAKHPMCKKIECYTHKSKVNFDRVFQSIKDDPGFVLISDNYQNTNDKFVISVMKDHTVLFTSKYNRISNFEGYGTREGIDAAKISGTKAFCIEGNAKGRFFYIRMIKSDTTQGAASKTKEKIASGKATIADIDMEIKRINDREKRSQEIDAEKQWEQLSKIISFDDNPDLFEKIPFTSSSFSQQEINAIAIALYENMDFVDHDYADEALKIKGGLDGIDAENVPKLKINAAQLFHLLRIFSISVLNKPARIPTNSNEVTALITMLRTPAYMPEKIAEIEESFTEKIAKRQASVKKRIAELNEQKKELKPAAAKAAPKKAAKKSAKK